LSTKESQIRCIWTDGSRDNLGNVGAAVAWNEGTEWTGLKYRLGRNKDDFDADLFALLRATIMIRDEIEVSLSFEVFLCPNFSSTFFRFYYCGRVGYFEGNGPEVSWRVLYTHFAGLGATEFWVSGDPRLSCCRVVLELRLALLT
jgi:hypothetical protein